MLVVKVEIWPYGNKKEARTIGRAYIANDGSGDITTGNYIAKFAEGEEKELESGFEFRALDKEIFKLSGHIRKDGFWRLLKNILIEKGE